MRVKANQVAGAMNRQSYVMRYFLMSGITAVILLVAYALLRYPSVIGLSPAANAIYFAILLLILVMYGWASIRYTQSTSSMGLFVLKQGLLFGLVIGLLWIIEVATDNLNFVQAGWAETFYRAAIVAVPVITMIAAARTVQQTGQFASGMRVGLWSGMISGLITFVTLMLITYLFQAQLQTDPQNIQEFMRSGAPNFATYSVADALVGATNHLWIGPLLGLIFGAIGGHKHSHQTVSVSSKCPDRLPAGRALTPDDAG